MRRFRFLSRPFFLFGLLWLLSHGASARVQNGGFETWDASTPTAWTTIDSGISVSSTSGMSLEGLRAAKVSVNTSTQASTDIRQTIEVKSGETYDYSVWVYHTQGSVKARLYVDGYRNYSNESLVNQWQQIRYSYSPREDKLIEVGLRFYDTSGFDGNEIV